MCALENVRNKLLAKQKRGTWNEKQRLNRVMTPTRKCLELLLHWQQTDQPCQRHLGCEGMSQPKDTSAQRWKNGLDADASRIKLTAAQDLMILHLVQHRFIHALCFKANKKYFNCSVENFYLAPLSCLMFLRSRRAHVKKKKKLQKAFCLAQKR